MFPVADIVDGYKDGYKVGFLCPKCNANIKRDWFRNIPLNHNWIFPVTITLMIIVTIWRHELEGIIGIDYNLIRLFIFAVGMVLLMLINRRNLHDIFFLSYTKFVNKEEQIERDRTKQPWE